MPNGSVRQCGIFTHDEINIRNNKQQNQVNSFISKVVNNKNFEIKFRNTNIVFNIPVKFISRRYFTNILNFIFIINSKVGFFLSV